MQKTAIIIIMTICMAGCTAAQSRVQQALNECPDLGIDVRNPDFNTDYKSKEIDGFYNCMIGNFNDQIFQNSLYAVNYFHQPLYVHGIGITPNQIMPDNLRYQQSLWKQVIKKQKTPEAAQETWLLWKQKVELTNASVVAASAAKAAANKRP